MQYVVCCGGHRYNGRPMSKSKAKSRKPPRSRDSPGHEPARLLLASGLNFEEVTGLLSPYGFEDIKRADANIQAMAGEPQTRAILARLLAELLDAVTHTADPDLALTHWERFLAAGPNRLQLFGYLAESPRILHLLCTIFGNSPALAQTLIRDAFLVYWLAEEHVLSRQPSRRALERAIFSSLENVTAMELKLEALRRFKRREMLRIGIRDLLRLASIPETTAALSDLAGVLIQAAYESTETALGGRYGVPMHRNRAGRLVKTHFAVMGMGKLGGRELNFSSDVDLIYVYESDDGQTRPSPRLSRTMTSIPNEEYFEYLARDLTKTLAQVTQEGYVFRVDLRLRAEGSVGRLARPLAGYEQYYKTRGQVWERLALLKAWPIAGDPSIGRAFLRVVKPFVLGLSEGPAGRDAAAPILAQVKAVKDMIDHKMAQRGHDRKNVKLGTGGIREIEFTVQTIQVLCGRTLSGILDRNTLGSLARFKRHRLLTSQTETALRQAYLFLRDVEHKLQMVHDLQTHALPDTDQELARCAIRLGYERKGRGLARFGADLKRHQKVVHQVFQSLFASPRRSSLLKAALTRRGRSA